MREQLLEGANPGGISCVYHYSLLTFLFISEAVRDTYTSRSFCMRNQKGNSSKTGSPTARKQWDRFPNWVGFGDLWLDEKLIVPLIEIHSLLDPY